MTVRKGECVCKWKRMDWAGQTPTGELQGQLGITQWIYKAHYRQRKFWGSMHLLQVVWVQEDDINTVTVYLGGRCCPVCVCKSKSSPPILPPLSVQ